MATTTTTTTKKKTAAAKAPKPPAKPSALVTWSRQAATATRMWWTRQAPVLYGARWQLVVCSTLAALPVAGASWWLATHIGRYGQNDSVLLASDVTHSYRNNWESRIVREELCAVHAHIRHRNSTFMFYRGPISTATRTILQAEGYRISDGQDRDGDWRIQM